MSSCMFAAYSQDGQSVVTLPRKDFKDLVNHSQGNCDNHAEAVSLFLCSFLLSINSEPMDGRYEIYSQIMNQFLFGVSYFAKTG